MELIIKYTAIYATNDAKAPNEETKEDKKTMEDLKERSFLKPSNVENKKGFFRKVKDFFE